MSGIPVISVEGDCIARAWENSLIALHRSGCTLPTQYDKPDDPWSRDATMLITVHEPLAEPMIHRDFPGGFEELQEYVMEVCDGIKDHLVRDPNDPADTRWEYTYHQRLFRYEVPSLGPIDQIERLCRQLADAPHTRRAQAVTWKVWEDASCYDPACLQSVWCRITPEGEGAVLNMNVRFRSNDAYKAAFMNMFALVQLQQRIAARVTELSGLPRPPGPLLPHGRQLPHLRLQPQGIPRPVPRRLGASHLRAAHDPLRRRPRHHGIRPPPHPREGPQNEPLIPSWIAGNRVEKLNDGAVSQRCKGLGMSALMAPCTGQEDSMWPFPLDVRQFDRVRMLARQLVDGQLRNLDG